MSTDTEAPIYKKPVLEFKSTSFSVPVLVVFSPELKLIEVQLKEKIARAPDFFTNSPLLIDLQNCNSQEKAIDVTDLINSLRKIKLFPVGISGGNEEQNKQAHKLHILTRTIRITNSKNNIPAQKQKLATENTEKNTSNTSIEADKKTEKPTETSPAKPVAPTVENMLIAHPIRSGQRIYAKGDLTILSHVSAGAEVMAEGNIHIYGALRGRALAGVQGNTESRIFCSDLQAELVSIAGHYKVNEEIDNDDYRQPTQIYLKEQTLIIKNL